MGKSNQIRWTESDDIVLLKAVDRQRKKLARVYKSNPDMVEYMPAYLSLKKRKETIKTREDFNKFLVTINEFTTRGYEKPIKNDKGIVLGNQAYVDRIQKEIKKANTLKKKNREQFLKEKTTINGVQQASTLKDEMMRKVEQYNKTKNKSRLRNNRSIDFIPIELDMNRFENKKEWDKFVESVALQSTDEYYTNKKITWIENYKQGIRENFQSEGVEIIDMIDKLTNEGKFDKIIEFLSVEKNASIGFIYETSDNGSTLNTIRDLWNDLIEKNKDGN